MASITFDTHKFIRRLKEAGVPESQAEAMAEALRDTQGEARKIGDRPRFSHPPA